LEKTRGPPDCKYDSAPLTPMFWRRWGTHANGQTIIADHQSVGKYSLNLVLPWTGRRFFLAGERRRRGQCRARLVKSPFQRLDFRVHPRMLYLMVSLSDAPFGLESPCHSAALGNGAIAPALHVALHVPRIRLLGLPNGGTLPVSTFQRDETICAWLQSNEAIQK
jgi:hypothetical protein